MVLDRGFPQSVDIAVLVYGYRLPFAAAELGNRGLSWLEVPYLNPIFSLEADETDVMLGFHWVCNGANFHKDVAIVDVLHDGNMFFPFAVGDGGYEFFHFLSATFGGDPAVYKLHDNVSASRAEIKFSCHNSLKIKSVCNKCISVVPELTMQRYARKKRFCY